MLSSIRYEVTLRSLQVMVVISLACASAASATTFEAISLEGLTRQSDQIVIGHIVETRAYPEGPGHLPGIHTRVRLQVEETLAGQPTTSMEFWVHGGRLGDRMRRVSGQATFRPGEETLVFLFRTPAGVLFPAGMARGKWSLIRAGGEIWVQPSIPLDGGHGEAAPPPSATVEQPSGAALVSGATASGPILLDELRARLRAAMGER